jgi:protein ImuA
MNRAIRLSAARALVPIAGPAGPQAGAAPRVGFGDHAIDARLGGGLAIAALHEFYAAAEADGPATTGAALLLALRCARPGPLVWLREDRAGRGIRPYGLGLAALGHDPAQFLLVEAPDTLALLRAAAEVVGCTSVAAAIIEPAAKAGAIDLTATRRLGLAAARSGVMTLLVRSGLPTPSAAQSRWLVATAASLPLAGNAPGLTTIELRLLRHRHGPAEVSARLEWDSDRRCFAAVRASALSGGVSAAAVDRPLPAARAA